MSLKGNFETFNLNSIFQLLGDDQKTGVLKVRNEDKEVRIYLKDGEIIYATGSHDTDRLGHFLKRKGIISQEQLQESLKQARAEKKALGEILLEKGFLTPLNLQEIICQQVEHMIFNLFLWDKGEFEYNDAALNLKGMIVAKINLVSLLLEASRRIDEMSIIKKHIPNDMRVYRITGKVSDKDEITLNFAELKILGLVDGQRSIREVIRDGGLDEYAAYKILYSLLSSGLIESIETQSENKTLVLTEEYKDYSTIVGTYHNILQPFFRSFEGELGKEAIAIFDESKQVAASQPYDIFCNYHIQNAVDINTQEISQQIAPVENYEDACQILIKSFNEYILNILSKATAILGPKMTQLTIQKINALLPSIDGRQTRINSKNYVIDEIKHVLSQALE
ncbi:MAG: DUF4388 domain-containing protein [Desulfobacterales bacterium]|jgi:hypothetical protein